MSEDTATTNDRAADLNRTRFAAEGTFVVSLGSMPGSGATTLLARTLAALKARGQKLAVIAGDQQTGSDSARLEAEGIPAVRANSGADHRIDAAAIARALVTQPAPPGGTLFIDSGDATGVDLGEAKRVVITSVSERADRPLEDLNVFSAADAVLLNKIDLGLDATALERTVHRVNPTARVFHVSGRTGAGLDAWLAWLEDSRTREFTAMASPV